VRNTREANFIKFFNSYINKPGKTNIIINNGIKGKKERKERKMDKYKLENIISNI
jgi:hypothetical protein